MNYHDAKSFIPVLLKGSVEHGQFEVFRRILSERLGTNKLLFLDSGRSAIRTVLRQSGLKGEIVGIPAFGCRALLDVVIAEKARPLLLDVDIDRGAIPISEVEAGIKRGMKAVIIVHPFGLAAPITELSKICDESHVVCIDDAAQAYGTFYDERPVGTIGPFGVLSLGFTKSFRAAGGGVLICNKQQLDFKAEKSPKRALEPLASYFASQIFANSKFRMIIRADSRTYLASTYGSHFDEARSSRMTEISTGFPALSATLALKRVTETNSHSRDSRNLNLIKDCLQKNTQYSLPSELDRARDRLIYLPILINGRTSRKKLLAKLRRNGIMAVYWYDRVLAEYPEFSLAEGLVNGNLRNSTSFASRMIQLPIFGENDSKSLETLLSILRSSNSE
jgi:dTDP-4-amino-4,6-dideoxygalactose transaminase